MSHYQVFRKLLFDLLNIKVHQDQCLLAINAFAQVMPKYPPEIVHPFSATVANKLKNLAPKTFLVISLINPNLIPEGLNNDEAEDTTSIIRSILDEHKQDQIDSLIIQLENSLTSDKILSNEALLSKMFEKLIKDKNYSQAVLSLLASLIPIIPQSLLFLQIPQTKTDDLIPLIPLSLILQSEINISLLSNILLLRFSFLVVQNIQEKLTTESVIPLHRLSLSGSCSIEAAIFALRRFPKTITRFRKRAKPDDKVAFGSVLTCLLTCVEIPELKSFVKENQTRLCKFFKSLCTQVKSVSVSKSFQNILSLLNIQGITPIAFVYSCWLNKPKKFLILDCLRKISPIDPSLPALVNEVSHILVNFPFLVCEICRKVIFSPSIANIAALQHLANTIASESGINDFILFTNSIYNHEYFFFATHIISLFDKDPDFTIANVKNAIENIIIISIFSESLWSARHLDRFSRWLPFLDEDSLCSILQKCQKENYRVNCRFILMLTYMPNFSRNMITKTNFFTRFLNHINQFFVQQPNKPNSNQNQSNLKNSNDEQFISINASLCIAWHNLFISVLEHPKTINIDKNIQAMFSIGAKTLVKLWENQLLHDLIVESFCDAILLEKTRNIIISVIGVTQANDQKFIELLMMYDEKSTKERFPGLRNNGGKQIERPKPSSWGCSYWIGYAFGQEISIKI